MSVHFFACECSKHFGVPQPTCASCAGSGKRKGRETDPLVGRMYKMSDEMAAFSRWMKTLPPERFASGGVDIGVLKKEWIEAGRP